MDWIRIVEQIVIIVVALGFTGTLIYFFFKSKPDAMAEDSAPMPIVARRILVWYLILLGLILIYAIANIGSAEFPDAGLTVEPIKRTDARPDPAPVLDSVYSQASPTDATAVELVLFGRNFTNESKVCFQNVEETPAVIGTQRLQLRLDQQNMAGREPIEIFVVNPKPSAATATQPVSGSNPPSDCLNPGANNDVSNSLFVKVGKARAKVSLFAALVDMDRELQLLLLALFAGALGSYVHAIKSLSDFIGNRTLTASWFWWYITRPFLGAAMALIFYAVLRGGFLAGTPADAKVVNPFGVVAVGALVGMFADKAAQKLGDIFDTLFTAKDPRSDKLTAPVIDKLVPDQVTAGTKTPVVLQINGDRLGKVKKVMLDKQERTPANVSDKQVTVTLQPDDLKQPRDIFITVADSDGVSPAATLKVVTDLSIVPPTGVSDNKLPDAENGKAYQAQFSAKGGTSPYQWNVVNPLGLSIDSQGKLTGTLPAPGDLKITIKLTDNNGISVSSDFNLTVT